MNYLLRIALAGSAVFLLASATVLASESGTPSAKTVSLDECIRIALKTAPEIGEADADIALTKSRLEEAGSHRYPGIDILSLAGPAPGAHRQDISPAITTNSTFKLNDLTWFVSTDVMITQPLWTFGKISENMKAATHGIEVDRARRQQKGNEIALEVKKYYYSILLARELQNVLAELQLYMLQGKQKVQKLIDSESPSGDPMDIFKLDAYSGTINKYMEEALKGEKLALAALKARLRLPASANLNIATERLEMDTAPLPDVAVSVERARMQRPEFRQISEGITARTALLEAARANYYPDIFLAGILSWAYSDGRDRIKNPYISDTFNHTYGGVVLGLKWHIDFGVTSARVAAARAQLDKLESTRLYADNFIPLQIQKAWLDMNEAVKVVQITKDSYQSAKRWGAAALANFDFGVGNPRDIYESVEIYGKMKAEHYQAIYNYQLAKAGFDYAIGEYNDIRQ